MTLSVIKTAINMGPAAVIFHGIRLLRANKVLGLVNHAGILRILLLRELYTAVL